MTTETRVLNLIRLGVLLAILLAPLRSFSEEPQLCHLGESIVEEMSLQLSANGKIDPTALTNSTVFLERCPRSLVPSFHRSTGDQETLRKVWIASLKSARDAGTNSNLNAFLSAAHRRFVMYDDPSLTKFLDGVFDRSSIAPDNGTRNLDHLLEEQATATLAKFSHCEGADCYSISDFLLFLLGSNPTAFWSAMHSDPRDAAKWLSQLPDNSFAGDPSDAGEREKIRRYLLDRISIPAKRGLQTQRSLCLRKLNAISFRSWQ
jgi:hypothetical protein